jgi:hypothetical protein
MGQPIFQERARPVFLLLSWCSCPCLGTYGAPPLHVQCAGLARAPREKDAFLCFHCVRNQRLHGKGKGRDDKGRGVNVGGKSSKKGEEKEEAGSARSSRSKAMKDEKAAAGKGKGKDKEVIIFVSLYTTPTRLFCLSV